MGVVESPGLLSISVMEISALNESAKFLNDKFPTPFYRTYTVYQIYEVFVREVREL